MTIDPETLFSHTPDVEMLVHYEGLLDSWNTQIENVIDEAPDQKLDSNNAGPHTELEYWRSRNQRLISIAE